MCSLIIHHHFEIYFQEMIVILVHLHLTDHIIEAVNMNTNVILEGNFFLLTKFPRIFFVSSVDITMMIESDHLIVHRQRKRILLPTMNHLKHPIANPNRYPILIHHLVLVVIVRNHRNDLDMIVVMMNEVVDIDLIIVIIDDLKIELAIPIRKNQSMNKHKIVVCLFFYSNSFEYFSFVHHCC